MSSELKVTFSDKMNKYQYDGHANHIPLPSMAKGKGKLWLGDRDSCSMVQLKHRNIKSVVNAQGDMHGLSKEESIQYCKIDPIDNNRSCLELAYRFIDAALERGEHVLVCCHSGLGKSASVILHYVMKKEGVSFADAHRRVEEQRHGVRSDSKTSGFRPDLVKLLQDFEQELYKKRNTSGNPHKMLTLTNDYGGYMASVSLLERTMQYADGKGIIDGGAGLGNGKKGGGGHSAGAHGGCCGSGPGVKTEQYSTLHFLSVMAVLVAVLYGCMYLVIGKR